MQRILAQERNDILLKVRCDSETKYWRVYDQFIPKYKTPLLASKVFSKHEAGAFDADPKMLAKVKLAIEAPPKMKIPWPETVSQCYGWFIEPLTDRDKRDPFMYFPRGSTEVSRLGGRVIAEKKRK
ncbi:unnamed protein product [Psylliodes chrysocephalus]|uniref:Uncharacterized protein n=1 Tax=Psylliodes chrysocephalus TaxID=3402493 RepID=A0A9P0CVC8_9CUCU|nr:unnamed protein product [Psylliodes chrysocephala]